MSAHITAHHTTYVTRCCTLPASPASLGTLRGHTCDHAQCAARVLLHYLQQTHTCQHTHTHTITLSAFRTCPIAQTARERRHARRHRAPVYARAREHACTHVPSVRGHTTLGTTHINAPTRARRAAGARSPTTQPAMRYVIVTARTTRTDLTCCVANSLCALLALSPAHTNTSSTISSTKHADASRRPRVSMVVSTLSCCRVCQRT
jgi:hypothetical protein